MASGSFHDTDTHSGSFHSSGGGSGGGGWIGMFVYIAMYMALHIDAFEYLSATHLISLVMVIAVFLLFFPEVQDRKRFAVIKKFWNRNAVVHETGVWSAEYSDNRIGSDETCMTVLARNTASCLLKKNMHWEM